MASGTIVSQVLDMASKIQVIKSQRDSFWVKRTGGVLEQPPNQRITIFLAPFSIFPALCGLQLPSMSPINPQIIKALATVVDTLDHHFIELHRLSYTGRWMIIRDQIGASTKSGRRSVWSKFHSLLPCVNRAVGQGSPDISRTHVLFMRPSVLKVASQYVINAVCVSAQTMKHQGKDAETGNALIEFWEMSVSIW